MVWLTKFVIRSLEFANRHLPARQPKHLLTGKRGELEAYLHLRSLGYTIVAANFRVPYDRGEIDLIGWDEGILCFIKVKPEPAKDLLRRGQQSIGPSGGTSYRSLVDMFVVFPATGRRRAASTSSASFSRGMAANLRSHCTKARSPGHG